MNQSMMVRGADGRLYALSANGVSAVSETGTSVTAAIRAGDRMAFDAADHEASRTYVNPGL
ncbi:MAG TPA: hypothetical protein VD995_06630 [Azospirillum sp.]|nr:hypothetical protein [Azospirillum sp.]